MDSALYKTRLTLLSHSKNMLNASNEEDWQRYVELDNAWLPMLEQAVADFGTELDDIGSELLADNKQIQLNVTQAQQQLLSELEQETKNTSQIKSYLK